MSPTRSIEMPRPSAADLLTAWERGRDRSWPGRADVLLAAAWPELSAEERAGLRIGQRDRTLLELRRELFGDRLDLLADCPDCREPLELTLHATRLLDEPAPLHQDAGRLQAGLLEIEWRAPTAGDLLAIAAAPSVQEARNALLARCVVAARDAEGAVTGDRLPAPVAERLAERLAEADPQARVELAMTCPACARPFIVLFDIVRHLWAEVEEQARTLLAEVHRLAAAHGWSEREILNLSPRRRQAYLELLT